MTKRQIITGVFIGVCLLLFWLTLSGCAGPKRVQKPVSVSSHNLEGAQGQARDATNRAEARTRTIVQRIEVIREKTDPKTAAELVEVRQEVERLQDDLRDANGKLTLAMAEGKLLSQNREDFRVWGETNEAIAHENAKGWKEEEARHAETRRNTAKALAEEEGRRSEAEADRDKAKAVASKRGRTLGLLGGLATSCLGLSAWGMKLAFAAPPWSLSLFAILPAVGYFGARLIL